jgi:hypothetical protein
VLIEAAMGKAKLTKCAQAARSRGAKDPALNLQTRLKPAEYGRIVLDVGFDRAQPPSGGLLE